MSALAAVRLPAGAAAEAGALPPEPVRLPWPSLSLSLPLSLLSPVPIVSCVTDQHVLPSSVTRQQVSSTHVQARMLLSAAFKEADQSSQHDSDRQSVADLSMECTWKGLSLTPTAVTAEQSSCSSNVSSPDPRTAALPHSTA